VTAIRRAGPDDAAAVAELLYAFNREYGDPTPPPNQLAVRIGELLAGGDTEILLGAAPPRTGHGRSEPCGVAVLRFRLAIWSQGLECYLAELYVAPAQRGQGIGRALMLEAMDVARNKGAGYMDLGTAEDDIAARALYESLGFDNHEGKPGGPVNYYYERDL
jgi:ribosomal protein S18 acetylase RimI-like enzyme